MRAAFDRVPTPLIRTAATLAVVAVLVGGCAGPPSTTGPGGDARAAGGTDGETGPRTGRRTDPKTAATLSSSPEGETLRDQAERDLEDFRQLRARTGDAAAEAGGPQANAAGADILWNDASGSTRRSRGPGGGPATVLPRANDTIEVRSPPAFGASTSNGSADMPAASTDITLGVDQLNVRLVQLRQDLYRRSIDSDQPIRELLAIASMAMIDPELELPSGVDRELNAEELELLEAFHQFYVTLGRDLDGQSPAHDAIVHAIRTLETTAIDRPQLELPTAQLCWRIGGFGDFDAFDRAVFLAHAEQQTILYLEIDDFASVQNAKGEWVTEVSQQLEIYSDRDGIPVWSEPWQKAVDRVQKPRRDFFTTQLVTLPKALSVGKYHLKIRVRDENSGAEAEESVPFEMVADPKLAARVGG